MVFIRDHGSVFDAPIDEVWRFVGSGAEHQEAHRHRKVRRSRPSGNSGTYSWEQETRGEPVRFTMRWTTFPPVGIAYEVLEGPFAGSTFFLYYEPKGRRTGVSIVGDFCSPTTPEAELPTAVADFFEKEFAQDSAALRRRAAFDLDAGGRGGSGIGPRSAG